VRGVFQLSLATTVVEKFLQNVVPETRQKKAHFVVFGAGTVAGCNGVSMPPRAKLLKVRSPLAL